MAVSSYNARAVIQLLLFPESTSPYLGAGALGFVGLRLPLGEHLSLFTEARAGTSLDIADQLDHELDAEKLGAFAGMAGLPVSF